MLKKIFKFVIGCIIGIFLFYLILTWVVLPLALPWLIKNQGVKFLKTPVQVRSVSINPFTWRLGINGLEILDHENQLMVGFERLEVNVSFLGLFQKMYHVEEILLDGLKIDVALYSDGSINLLNLFPKDHAAPAGQQPSAQSASKPDQTSPKTAAKQNESNSLPLVVVDNILLRKGEVHFIDQTLRPNFITTLSEMDIHVTGLSTRPDSRIHVTFLSKLDKLGTISSETLLDPFVQPLRMETSFTLDHYALQVLTPYTGKYTGHALKDGNLTLRMDYRIENNKISAGHKFLIQRFAFGEKVESNHTLNLPFALAVALLEDPRGRIDISLPVKGDMSAPDFEYLHIVGQVARNFFLKLVTKPFSFLASVIGSENGDEELGTVKFLPGKAEISDEDRAKLKILVRGLKDRPKLNLEINGTYDPQADWKTMKTEIFNRDYNQLKAETTRSESWVYQMLYQRQFGVRELWRLSKSFKLKKGGYDEAALNAAIKTKIIEHGGPDKSALEVLAQARAHMVYEEMLNAGLDAKRMIQGQTKAAQMSMGFVPLEFTLTVFDDTSNN